MKPSFKQINKSLFSFIIIIICGCFGASAQNTTVSNTSRINVVANETTTTITVSNFPKNATIVVTDKDYNLLFVTSTNEVGAKVINLPVLLKNELIVKTLNSEVVASNTAAVNSQAENNIAKAATKAL